MTDSFARTQKRTGHVDIDDVAPIVERDVLKRLSLRKYPGVVEQHVDPAEGGASGYKSASTEASSVTSQG